MTIRARQAMLAILAFLAVGAGDALAEVKGQIGYGQRQVDFHRFTDARGEGKAMGSDLGAAVRFSPAKAPWGIGLFYSEQFYNLDSERYYFETVRARELGLDAAISLGDKGISPEIGFGYTFSGQLVGKTVSPTLLEKSQGGAVPTSGEATWTYSMTGMHIRPGASFEIGKGGLLTVGFDISRQSAKLRTVNVRSVDQTGAYDDYAKSKTSFNSYAVLVGLRAEP